MNVETNHAVRWQVATPKRRLPLKPRRKPAHAPNPMFRWLAVVALSWALCLPALAVIGQEFTSPQPWPGVSNRMDRAKESHADEPQWRRTAQGWERSEGWIQFPPARPVCHPGLLAALQVLMSLFALVAWPVEHPNSPTYASSTICGPGDLPAEVVP